MFNYKQLLADFGSIAYHHEQIKSYGFGDLAQCTNDIETKQEPLYTRMYIVPGDVYLNQNHIHYNLSIIIMDRVNNDLSNLKDVMSDTLEISKDIWTVLLQSYTQQQGYFAWDIIPDQSPNVASFLERFETIVAGWTMNISVQIKFDYDQCSPPMLFGYGFPQDQSFEAYRVMIDDYQRFATTHEQINSFGFGDIPQLTNDIETNQEPLYPRMYVHNELAKFHVGHIHLTWKIFFVDRLADDLSNQQEVLSDMLEIVKDLFSKMYLSEYEADFDAVVNPFFERTESNLGGWILNLSFTQKYDYNRCVLPMLPFGTVPPSPTPSNTPTPTPTPILQDGIWKNVNSIWETVNKFWGSYAPLQPTPTPTATNNPTPSVTATNTPTPSVTAFNTPTPSITPTLTPSITPTMTLTPTPSITPNFFDTDAYAFIVAAGITGFTNQNAVNSLVIGMKTNNIWNKMIAVYPFMQGTPTSTKYNLKDPRDTDDAYRIRWQGGVRFYPEYITTTGAPNGQGDTLWSPFNYNATGTTIWNNLSHGVYRIDQNLTSPDHSNNKNYVYGVGTNSNGSEISYWTITGATNHYIDNNNSISEYAVQVSSIGTTGMFVSSRTSASLMRAYKNGSQFGTDATGTLPYPTDWFPPQYANDSTMKFFQLNKDGLGNYWGGESKINWFHLSMGLTDADVSNLYTLVQNFNITLNRSV